MWERFSERAKHVVSAARAEATRLDSEYVRTEHILLGLCREPDSTAVRALVSLGVDIEALAMMIERQVPRGNAVVSEEDINFTPRAKKALEMAVEEARGFNHSYIGTEHILLGLVKEEEGIVAKVLKDMNINLHRMQGAVLRILKDDIARGKQTSEVGHSQDKKPARKRAKKSVKSLMGEETANSLEFLLDPGSASPGEIAELLNCLSDLYRTMTGKGLQFTIQDCREPQVAWGVDEP